MDLKGKRLLILGGTYNTEDIRRYADEQGIVLIATGDKSDHPLAKIADEYHKANVRDPQDLIRLVKEYKIDGIFAGGNEDIISILFDVFDATGLPFYSTREQWAVATGDKRLFKNIARKAGLPVVPEFAVSDAPTREELDRIEYPVVVKPVDGMGSRGVYLCHNEKEMLEARKNALPFSRSKTLMVEKFMTGFITVFYMTIIDGEVHVASMCDKYAKPADPGKYKMATIAQTYLYPSRHLQYCIDNYLPAMKNLLKLMNIKNGVAGIQGFCDGKDIVFTEMGYRLGGTSQQNYTRALHGYNNMLLLMNYALAGKMTDEPWYENPFFDKVCGTLQMVNTGGTVAKEEGIDEVLAMPEVINFEHQHHVGDVIPFVDNVSMVHFRVFVVADDLEHLKRTIDKIQNTLAVYDTEGKYMLDAKFDVERLGTQ